MPGKTFLPISQTVCPCQSTKSSLRSCQNAKVRASTTSDPPTSDLLSDRCPISILLPRLLGPFTGLAFLAFPGIVKDLRTTVYPVFVALPPCLPGMRLINTRPVLAADVPACSLILFRGRIELAVIGFEYRSIVISSSGLPLDPLQLIVGQRLEL